MTKRIQRLRGTKDLIGADALLWESVEKKARSVFRLFGYEPIRTPVIEETALFCRSIGEMTDIVEKEMYRFKDRSDTDIALRPEGTAGVVRAYIENNLQMIRPMNRFYYEGPMFRAERPQAGRLRQFHQIGAELFGGESFASDVEIVELVYRILRAVGISGPVFEINNLGSPGDRESFCQALKVFFKKESGSMCEDCRRRLEKNVLRVLDCKAAACQKIIEKAPVVCDYVSGESKENYRMVLDAFESLQKREGKDGGSGKWFFDYKDNPRIIRGLDYYTGVVFEVKHQGLGAQDAIAAGGRYDTLADQLGGPKTAAVGFSLGIERLLMAMDKEGALDRLREEISRESKNLVMIAQTPGCEKEALKLLSLLRANEIPSSMDLGGRSLKSQLRLANKIGSRFVLIMGEDEIKRTGANLKDMSGKDDQKFIPEADIVSVLKDLLDKGR